MIFESELKVERSKVTKQLQTNSKYKLFGQQVSYFDLVGAVKSTLHLGVGLAALHGHFFIKVNNAS